MQRPGDPVAELFLCQVADLRSTLLLGQAVQEVRPGRRRPGPEELRQRTAFYATVVAGSIARRGEFLDQFLAWGIAGLGGLHEASQLRGVEVGIAPEGRLILLAEVRQ